MSAATPTHTPLLTTVTRLAGVVIGSVQGVVIPLLDKPVSTPVVLMAGGMMAIGEAYRIDVKRRNEGGEP